MKTVYITGGTGFLGSHFIRNYLSTREYGVQCFVRGSSGEACTGRLKQAVLAVNRSYPEKPALHLDGVTAIRSDITLPRWDSAKRGWIRHGEVAGIHVLPLRVVIES